MASGAVEKTEERRARIIEAAIVDLGHAGYWRLDPARIVAELGMDTAVFDELFAGKPDLLTAVLDHCDELQIAMLQEALAYSTRIEAERDATLVEFCRGRMRALGARPDLVRCYAKLALESLEAEHPAHEYFCERERINLELLMALTPQDRDPIATARHLLAAMDGVQLQWLRHPGRNLAEDWDTAAHSFA